MEDEPRARRAGARRHAGTRAGGAGGHGGAGGGGGVRRRRPAARPRWHGVRSRGERDPRMARPARSDFHRRRRGDRRARARTRGVAVTRAPHGRGPDVAVAAQRACLLEATAPKPGNVSPAADFHDVRYDDFLATAAAIRPALAAAAARPLADTTPTAAEAAPRCA